MSCTNIIIDLRAVKAPFYIEEGDHFNFALNFFDADNVAIDMSTILDAQLIVDDVEVASLGDGITVTGVDTNTLTFSKANSLTVGKYQYSIVVTDSDGLIKTYIDGKMTVE
jgi:hypothetical protein